MHDLLRALTARRENLVARHFELRVLPNHNALVLSGYAMLRTYGPVPGEDPYAGAESRQVKAALQVLLPKDGSYVVEVKLTPALERQREAAYPFFITQRFDSPKDLEREVQRVREAGFIGEHTYPIMTPTHEGEEA